MDKSKLPLEDIRDKGGLAILKDVPIGKHINFYGKRFVVLKTEVDPRYGNDDSPCARCYFYDHQVSMKGLKQCAALKYCTSPNRTDRTSVVFQIDYYGKE